MEREQEKELFDLIFNEPLSQRPGWPVYQPPERAPSKSLRHYVSRLKEYQKQYFEEVEKRIKDKGNGSAGLGLIPYINWIAQAKREQETTFDKRLWSIQGIQEHSAC